jgi:hypothetical protein
MAATDKVYVVVTRGREACPHTKGSAIPKDWTLHPGFETISFSEAHAKAAKLGKPVLHARRTMGQGRR